MMSSSELTHIDEAGNARMVDVGHKPETKRVAVAKGEVHMLPETLTLIREGNLKKGDVLTVAKVAGISAAKRTSDLIPFCHPLALDVVNVDLTLDGDTVRIRAEAATTGRLDDQPVARSDSHLSDRRQDLFIAGARTSKTVAPGLAVAPSVKSVRHGGTSLT